MQSRERLSSQFSPAAHDTTPRERQSSRATSSSGGNDDGRPATRRTIPNEDFMPRSNYSFSAMVSRWSAAREAAQASLNDDCSICIERKVDESVLVPCMHTFCYECIHQWVCINPRCPLCKRKAHKIIHDITGDREFTEVNVSDIRAAAAAIRAPTRLPSYSGASLRP